MSAQSSKLVAQIEAATAKVCSALALQIDHNLRRAPSEGGTPIDTNHARSNWVPSVGQPATAEVDGDGAHGAGVIAVATYTLEKGPLFVSNNASYIERLNLGSSQQAPAGFIEACIAEAIATIEQRFGTTIDIATVGAGTFADLAGGAAATGLASSFSPFGD